MAVKDDIYYPTEDLILSKPRRHFRTTVNAVHWQLRSLIGTEKDNYIYFATGKGSQNVQRLNRTTHETETIKQLTFQPRCLVARNGWVCCGGETGEFAAIRVGEETGGTGPETAGNLDPDDRLPIDLDPSRPEESLLASLARLRPSNKAPSKKVGKDRVNCITLWFPPTLVPAFEGAYNQPVAVLANNDKSVSVVGLWEDLDVIDELEYPDCVNRAVISPDGRLLVAVSDDPYLYVHEQVERPTPSSTTFRAADRPTYEWKLCAKIHLRSQRKEDRTDSRGSFAACFSSTGRFLAVGTQYGTISIFNVAAFTATDVDPLITWFRSSRTYAELGAVRDMTFAPGPIDLLAWTEDRGRVGVADLRSGFISRQIINLDKLDDFEHINVVEVPLERGFIDPRLLETRGDRNETLSSNFANALDLSLESRANRRSETRDPNDRFSVAADAQLQVLEAFREERRRREQRAAGQAEVTSGSRLPWPERGTRPPEISRASERSASVTRAVNDILGNIRDHRERIRDGQGGFRATMRDVDSSATDRERRRGTFNSSTTGSARATPSTSMSTATSQDSERRALLARLIAPNSPPGVSSSSENLEALYETDPNLSRRSFFALTRDRDADIRRLRILRAAYLMRDWDTDNPTRRTNLGGYGARSIAADPYDTSGLAWSDDGQILYVGTENGIYEFHVNIHGRRLFPSLGLR